MSSRLLNIKCTYNYISLFALTALVCFHFIYRFVNYFRLALLLSRRTDFAGRNAYCRLGGRKT